MLDVMGLHRLGAQQLRNSSSAAITLAARPVVELHKMWIERRSCSWRHAHILQTSDNKVGWNPALLEAAHRFMGL